MDTTTLLIIGGLSLLVLAGVIYLWEDIFGRKKSKTKISDEIVTNASEKELV